jgi:hypothetical protein
VRPLGASAPQESIRRSLLLDVLADNAQRRAAARSGEVGRRPQDALPVAPGNVPPPLHWPRRRLGARTRRWAPSTVASSGASAKPKPSRRRRARSPCSSTMRHATEWTTSTPARPITKNGTGGASWPICSAARNRWATPSNTPNRWRRGSCHLWGAEVRFAFIRERAGHTYRYGAYTIGIPAS